MLDKLKEIYGNRKPGDFDVPEETEKLINEITETIFMKKQIKDLKPGDILYLLDTDNYFVSVGYVESLEKDDWGDDFKVTWKEEDEDLPLSHGYASEDDTRFYEELGDEESSEDDFGGDYDPEEEERLVFLSREDAISWVEDEISEIKKNLEELP